ncbi:ATP-binding cassette domain-containing protein [Actinoplanes lobatus]|uniref:ATP-binding cassette domain-containing protein n=1 Tax=Actinoplanes lobatus TaxID=113568 RepID=UPI00165FAAAE|nr:ATP-binding cassette domain-containing protein [Actinoplanes lobatus]
MTGARVSRGPVDPRLLRHARTSRAGIALLTLIGIGQAAATIAIAVALCGIVTGLVTGRSVTVFPEQLTGTTAILLLAAAFTARGALAWAEQVVAQRTAATVTDELRRSLLDRVIRRGPAWVAAYGSGRLTTVLGTGLDALRPWFSGYLPALVLGALLPPLVIVIMAAVDPASAVIALLTMPLLPILGALIGWATKARAERRWAADARLAGHFLDVVRGLPTLKMYGRADHQIDVIADLTDRHRAATMRVLRVAFLSSTALDLVGTLAVGLIAVQAGLRVAAGAMDLGPALLVILLAPEAYRPLREMAARYHASTDAGAVIADVDEILTAPSPSATGLAVEVRCVPTSSHRVPAPEGFRPSDTGRWGVRAAGLRARYPGSLTDALLLPELFVHAGELVALRGPSGAGKTTALRVLAGLHPAESGALAVGSTFYLPQRSALPHARTVADAFPAGTGPAEILAALRSAGLTGEITPETPLGEQVSGISAGQRQRLALAVLLHRAGRAMSSSSSRLVTTAQGRLAPRFPPPVVTLLLDEPTAHLDVTAERLIINRLRDLAARGCAVLVVAHRPALLAAADRIIDVAPPAAPALLTSTVTAVIPNDAEQPSWSAGPSTAAVLRPTTSSPTPTHQPVQPSPATPAQPLPTPAPNTAPPPHGLAPHTASRPGRQGTAQKAAEAARDLNATTHTRPSRSGPKERQGTAQKAAEAGRGFPGRRGWGRLRRPGTAVALGAGSSLAGILLTGAAAWLLVRASVLPPVLSLSAAVVLVRGSAVARPLLRYLERLLAHDVAFASLGARRAQVYANLIPHVPGPRLHRRGDLLTRLVDDVDARVDGLLRGRLPMITAAVTVTVCVLVVVWAAPALGVPLAVGLVIAGVLAPAIAARQVDRQEAATGAARSALRDAVVETVDGIEELSGGGGHPGVPQERSRTLAALEARAARGAGLAAATAHLGWGAAAAGAAVLLTRGGLSAEWSAVVLLSVIVLGETVAGLPEAAIAGRRAAGAEHRVSVLTAGRPPINMTVKPDFDMDDGAADADFNMDDGVIHTDVNILGVDGRISVARPMPAAEASESSEMRAAGAVVDRGRGEVRVEGLVAGWDPRREPVLNCLDLHLPAGSRTVVTGRSGSGKSTLAAVLAGLLTPHAGAVIVNTPDAGTTNANTPNTGTAIVNVPDAGTAIVDAPSTGNADNTGAHAATRDGARTAFEGGTRTGTEGGTAGGNRTTTVTAVGQTVLVGDDTGHVFASTVRENLRLGDRAASDEQLDAVLRRVGLGEWLAGLPAGLDTWLGTGGSTVSGGQRRRLATARALLADPALLILDEPTEGIDEDGAHRLMADLLGAADGRTVLVFAHRVEGFGLADRILSLSRGKLTDITP